MDLIVPLSRLSSRFRNNKDAVETSWYRECTEAFQIYILIDRFDAWVTTVLQTDMGGNALGSRVKVHHHDTEHCVLTLCITYTYTQALF